MGDSKPVRSMTGFAQAQRETEAGELLLSLRSVNHRGLDLHFHHSHEFSSFENGMRALLKEKVGRGHVEVRASLSRHNGQRAELNTGILRQYAEMFQKAADSLGLTNKPDLNALLTLPGVVTHSVELSALEAGFEGLLMAALAECTASFNECREREGAKLIEQLIDELAQLEQAASEIRSLRSTVLPALHQRLHEKVRELLNSNALSDSRIVEECALLADRSDIEEELTRLTVHRAELRRILEGGGAVGKQIDFLLQEMNRETNTILAKSSTAGDAGLKITSHGLAIKANIERIREQALNLE